MTTRLIHVYLQDHHAGAAAGVDLFRRAASSLGDPDVRREVARMRDETVEDRKSLEALMRAVGCSPSPAKDVLARLGERLGRFKPNKRLVRRSPLSDVVELEALSLAVRGKQLGWKSLIALDDPVLPAAELTRLADRADDQIRRLEEMRTSAVPSLRSP